MGGCILAGSMSRLASLKQRLFLAWRAGADYAWDNPTAEHDARAILVGPKVGLWLGLELVVVIAGALIAFLGFATEVPGLTAALAELGPGTYLISAAQASLAMFLTLVVPLRAVGLLEGPRWRGYLDQLVTTGITPWRYYAGKWASTQPFLLALIAATFPLAALFALLGGCDPLRVIGGYVLLFAWGNLLLAVSLGLGVVLHEVAALLLVWLLFSAATIVDYTPLPATLACWTPHRFLLLPFVAHLTGSEADVMTRIYGVASLAGVELPWAAWALAMWALASALAAIACALGPLHTFSPGLNNFGAVVLPGDRARTILRRVRPFLVRRVELAFLFENRGPRLVRWTLGLRAVQQLLFLVLLALLLPTAALHPAWVEWTNEPEVTIGLHLTACGIVLLATLVTLVTARGDAHQVLALGRHRVPLLALDGLVFAAACVVVLVVSALSFAPAWEAMVECARARGRSARWLDELWPGSSVTLAVLVTTAISTFLVIKSLGARLLGRGAVLLLALLYLIGLLILPSFAAMMSGALSNAEEVAPEARALVRPLWVISQASPLFPAILAWEQRLPPWLGPTEEASWLMTHAFWVWHPLWLGLLLPRVVGQGFAARAAAVAHERRRRGERPPPEVRCPRCPAGEVVPLGWSWWGGMLGARVLRYVRCLECGSAWSRIWGRSVPGMIALVLLGRLLLVGLAAIAVMLGLAWGLA